MRFCGMSNALVYGVAALGSRGASSRSWIAVVPSSNRLYSGVRNRPEVTARPATPRSSKISMTRGCTALPREPGKNSVAASTIRTGMEERAS